MLIKFIKFNVILTIVLGIMSVLISFFSIYSIVVSILCIILSIFLFKNHKIVILSIILSILSIIFAIIFNNKKDPNYLLGTWNCRIFNTNDYIATFKIEDESYFWGKYDDLDNNYMIGKYELKKKNNTDDSIIYELKLNSSNYIENGSMKNEIINDKYEVSLNKEDMKQILLKKNKSDLIFDCSKN